MSNQPRSYQRSSSFQVTLFTYLLFFALLGSCLSSIALITRDNDQSAVFELLDVQSQRFIDYGCTPFDGVWVDTSPSTQAKPYTTQRHPDTNQRHLTKTVLCDDQPVQVGINSEASNKHREAQMMLLVIDLAVIVVLMAVMYAIGRFVVKGTNKIAVTAQNIMTTGDLSQRIEIDNRWDDLSYSALTINELLARIEELMNGVKRVSDSIAHDLRTPLTRLRNDIENVRRQRKDDEELAPVVEEVDHLIRTFNSLLRISRIETEQRRTHFMTFDLHTLLHDVGNFYQPLMEDKDIHFDEHLVPVSVYADKDLIFQAIANVLDNALKFTQEGGQIQLRCQANEHTCAITISDTGGGIPEEHLDKVMQRFYRADASRNPEGTGLGLALVGAVAQLHKGEVALHNDNLGLRVTLKLPVN